MSIADWSQIEVAETISKAFHFRNTQTLADKENDAYPWSKTPMQQFRLGIDAQEYLDGLFNELDRYPERKNQTMKKVTQNPSHGKSYTDSGWGTEEISQVQSVAAARLRRSARDIRSGHQNITLTATALKKVILHGKN